MPGYAAGWRQKVHPKVREQAARGPAEFLVFLREQADLRSLDGPGTRRQRGSQVYQRLTEVARRSQAPLIELLESRGLEYRTYWIANMIWVRGGIGDVETLARRTDVLRVDPNPRVRLAPAPATVKSEARVSESNVGWNILQVSADRVWSLGFNGQGVVVGGQDTGYQWDHPALRDQYRGWSGTDVDHDYNWHDAIHEGSSSCGVELPEPCDDHDHGTHTMGTMIGDDGGTNRIGMAPGARWIGCRNMADGHGTPETYTECFQWFVAPTDRDGANPDPSRAPHVINNSWVCPPEEGCAVNTLRTVVENTRAAGIVVVGGAGNEGSFCSTVADPPAIYGASLSVGAIDCNDSIAWFSARGPVIVDGSGRLKPDVVAPGVSVRSSVNDGDYRSFSGTSMAGPHAAGLVALLLSARPDLIGRVDEIEALVRAEAHPLTSSQTCGELPGTSVPNHTFGHGRIDALEVLLGDADEDGRDNLGDCLPIDGGVWSAPGPVPELALKGAAPTEIRWVAPPEPGAGEPQIRVLRSGQPWEFSAAVCLPPAEPDAPVLDDAIPDGIFYYLVQVENRCGRNLGSTSDGALRSGASCP